MLWVAIRDGNILQGQTFYEHNKEEVKSTIIQNLINEGISEEEYKLVVMTEKELDEFLENL